MSAANLQASSPRRLLRPVSLVHHGVDDVDAKVDPRRLIVAPGLLERQIRLLRLLGYGFATAEEALGGDDDALAPPRGHVLLTFDDGLANNLTVAAPLLEGMGVRASFYVCPGMWGAQHAEIAGQAGRLLDESGVLRLVEHGMELGSHTLSHSDLTKLDDDSVAHELAESKRRIEQLTGRPCRTLAYPYGLFDARIERAAAAAGYELAWSWRPGPWRRFAAPRLPAPTRIGAGGLALKLAGLRRRGF